MKPLTGYIPDSASRYGGAFFCQVFPKFLSLTVAALILMQPGRAQFTISGGSSAAALASKLVGTGITIISPTLTCPSVAYGTFSGTSSLPIDSGIVLTSGRAKTSGSLYGVDAAASNMASTDNTTAGDADLTTLCGHTTYDACVLEFDFRPAGDTVKFNYVFGSEEYGCCTCSGYNDVFGFFISGPGYGGATNIAVVPGTSVPVCINSVNCSSGSSCSVFGPGSPFCSYYVNNSTSSSIVYYGLTTKLTAVAPVTACDTYHLKIGVADASDHILDSGVFLEAGSLSSTGIHTSVLGLNPHDTTFGSQYCVRGCGTNGFVFARSSPSDTETVHFTISGTAINGYDYTTIPDSMVLLPGHSADTIIINALPVTPAGPRTIMLRTSYTFASCGSAGVSFIDSMQLTIYDSLGVISGPATLCPALSGTYIDTLPGGTWSSSNTSILNIGSMSGIASGVSAGSVTVSYNAGGCSARRTVTVNPLPFAITGPSVVCAHSTITLTDATAGGAWSSSSPSIATIGSAGILTGLAAGTTIVTYTAPSGCFVIKNVTVNQSPSIITGPSGMCAGNVVTFTDSVAGGIWTSSAPATISVGSSSGSVTALLAGTGIITYTLADGCSAILPVTVNPLPALITGPTTVCVGTTATLTDVSSGGTWSSGMPTLATIGSASGIITGINPGSDLVLYTLPTGCARSLPVTISSAAPPITGLTTICAGNSTTLYDAGSGTWHSSAPAVAAIGLGTGVVTAVSSGTTIITYTLPSGCTATTTVSVTGLPTPISGALMLCMGNTDTLYDATAGGIWSSSDYLVATIDMVTGIVRTYATDTVTITYTDLTSGCTTAAVLTINPTPSPITGVSSICPGSSAALYDLVAGGVWSSSAPSVATISSISGLYYGTFSGTAIITYSTGPGCSVTYPVTINASPAPISGPVHLCLGASATLTDATPGGIWTSASTSIATIGSTSGIITGTGAGPTTISYTAGTPCPATETIIINAPPPPIAGVNHLCAGSSATLTDGIGTWTSTSTGVATIGTGGIVHGVTAGITTISFTSPTGCAAAMPFTVNPLPSVITGGSLVCLGASVTEADSISGGIWSATPSATATIGALTGIATGMATGIATISYTLPTGCYATKPMTVNVSAAPITGLLAICPGGASALADGTPGGTWTSSAPGIATVGSATGAVSGAASGTATITYNTTAGCNATAVLTVNPLPSVFSVTGGGSYCAGGSGLHVRLSGSTPGITYQLYNGSTTVGAPIGGTGASLDFGLQTAVGVYTVVATNTATSCTKNMTGSAAISINPAPAPITGGLAVCVGATLILGSGSSGGTWSSASPGIATVGSLTGTVTGITTGLATITYTLPTTCYATTTITVSTTPVAITGVGAVCAGSTTLLSNAVAGGTWTSSLTGTATVGSLTGSVTGIAAGTSTITYSLGTGCSVMKVITVNPLPAAITGSTGLCAGHTTSLVSTTIGGTWVSGTGSVATISTTGTVTGVAAGTATISYVLPSTGCTTMTTVTVNALPPLITGVTHVCLMQTTMLTDLAGGGSWSSSSTGTATIGSTGLVSGLAAGTTIISYSLGTGCATGVTVTVSPLPAAISGASALCAGSVATMTDGTAGGSWSSSLTGIATIGSSSGTVTGMTAGTAVISYTAATGCVATKPVSVNEIPATIAGTGILCAGGSTALTSATPGGMWSSGSSSIATIGSSGIVTGIIGGAATITYTLPTGCYTTRPITVTPLPSPITGTASVCVGSMTTLGDATIGGTWTSSATGTAIIGSASGLVTGASAGIATITYTSPGGCSVTRIVTVNALPGPITGITAACMGAATPLSDITTGGTWSSSNTAIATVGSSGIVTGINAGTAIITYMTTAGCITTLWMTVNPAPPAITGTADICSGSSTTLTDASPGGTWTSTNTLVATIGASTGVATGIAGGSTIISYTAATGCAATRTLSVIVVPAITGLRNICAWGDTLHIADAMTTGSYSSSGVTVVNTGGGNGLLQSYAPGVGTIYYTIPIGCWTSASVTVNPLPGAITGSYNICTGNTTTLHDAVTGGTWTSGAPAIAAAGSSTGVVTGIAAGTAYITYTLPTGCKADTPVVISLGPSFVAGFPTLSVGTSATYYDLTAGGIWTSSNTSIATIGSTTGLAHALSVGLVTFTYTLSTGCYATKTVTVEIAGPSNPLTVGGISEFEDIRVMPNPNKGDFMLTGFIANAEASEELSAEMTDMLGRRVYEAKLQAHDGMLNEDITVSNKLANGMYLLTLSHEGERKVARVVIAR